ncbi:uncharacterized protein LOC142317866 [Lycorma delicatula]|uniref:uncharacterized protein LOC142317866 n=1 Tax=Lycorma delicatula TaxID=130591 RepID=UPI003F50F538
MIDCVSLTTGFLEYMSIMACKALMEPEYTKNPLQGSELISALSKALEGSAAQWLSQVAIPGIQWPQLKELFVSRFGGQETATAVVLKIHQEAPTKDESVGAFGIRLRSSLKARWRSLTVDEIVNAVVLARLTHIDNRVERVALTSDIKTEAECLSEMRGFSYTRKRPISASDNSSTSDLKRFKPAASGKCHFCGEIGHKKFECPKLKKKQAEQSSNHRGSKESSSSSRNVTCFKCGVAGHIAPNCTAPDVDKNDKIRLVSILKEYESSFITGFPRTRVNSGELDIRLIDTNVTVQRRPYRLSVEERQIVRERINELLEANVIRPSNSPFASPILLVKKKDGSDRLCVDYRELNKNTVADKFPLSLILDQIPRLRKAKFYISLDMASGFHQIPIHSESIKRTAFVTPDGQFEFLTMPFGLKNAPSVFQRAILKALGWDKTLDKVYEYYWFEGMSKYVRKFVDNCITCKLSKAQSGKIQAELHPIPKTRIPWHTVHIDITEYIRTIQAARP